MALEPSRVGASPSTAIPNLAPTVDPANDAINTDNVGDASNVVNNYVNVYLRLFEDARVLQRGDVELTLGEMRGYFCGTVLR